MNKLIVGGVPEHFNTPWHLGIQSGFFKSAGIDLEWLTYHGGTGEMTQALRDETADACVLLTEGIISDIAHGSPARIISKFIITPLIWGIFTGEKNELNRYGEIFDRKFAISRYGSGSHLMPIVDADQKGKRIQDEQWVVIKNLNGALESLDRLDSDVFYWEKYTTQPYVEKGILRELGAYVTPWPSFMIAASEKALREKATALKKMLNTIYFLNEQLMNAPIALDLIGERHPNIESEALWRWFHTTEWATNDTISMKTIDNVVETIFKADIIKERWTASKFLWKL